MHIIGYAREEGAGKTYRSWFVFCMYCNRSVRILVLDANERVEQSSRETARLLGLERPRQLADLSKADDLVKVIRGLAPGGKQTCLFRIIAAKRSFSSAFRWWTCPGGLCILVLNDIASLMNRGRRAAILFVGGSKVDGGNREDEMLGLENSAKHGQKG